MKVSYKALLDLLFFLSIRQNTTITVTIKSTTPTLTPTDIQVEVKLSIPRAIYSGINAVMVCMQIHLLAV